MRFPVLGGIAARNEIIGSQNGIVCIDANNLAVEANLIEGASAQVGFAIMGTRVGASSFAGNRIGGAISGVLLTLGRQNRIADNDCRNGWAGISISWETGTDIAGNWLDMLDLWAVYGTFIAAGLA